ncbi:CPBP family glutamic-type intramembrane protease [Plantibacter sp. YIM 135249]|uniref:CPBP family glutamic-type intramembrane protease n=1 Tax=Plantibacter sp. YIM 135249 TaxID=3423918 RepID=UPI003D3299F4
MSEQQEETTASRRGSKWWLAVAAAGAVVAIGLSQVLETADVRGAVPGLPVVGYLVVWVPLLAAVIAASFLAGTRSPARDFGLAFRPLDLFWGLIVGLLARCVAVLVEVLVNGRPLAVSGPTLDADGASGTAASTIALLVWGTIATVAIAPFVEELFFRGLVLRGTMRALGGSRIGASIGASAVSAVAVVVAAIVFALVHLVGVATPAQALTIGLSTLVVGLGAGAVAAASGRLGGAIIAHAVFNGSVVVFVWIAALTSSAPVVE